LKNVWGDLKAKLEPIKPTTMEAHPSLKLTLLPFQKESLYWMKQQEKGPWKGGMLADESESTVLQSELVWVTY
jgi:DNA repair protein RAD16